MSYSSEVLADSPVVYYRLGEASGTTMTDSSGNGRNGSYDVGTPTLGTAGALAGDSDTAVTFPGSARAIGWADDDSIDGLSTFTVEAWIKPTSVSGTPQIVSRDGSSARSFQFRLNAGKLEFLKLANGTVTASSATTLSTGTWYHVAAVYNGTDIRLYINGSLDGTPPSATGTLGTVARQVEVAARVAANFFSGVIDEVAIYATALTSTRIAAHYTAGTTLSGSSGSGSLSLSASGAATVSGTGTAAIALSGSGAATAPATAAASLSLSGTGAASGSNGTTGSGSLALSASGDATAPGAASATLDLTASGATAAPAAGTGSLTLSGSGVAHRAGTPYESAVLDDTPIAYYRLGDAVDTGSPTTAHDDSGFGHDGTYAGGAESSTPGAIIADTDGYLALDAATNSLSVPHWAGLDFTTFTLEAWIQVTSVPAFNRLFGRTGGSSAPFTVGNNSSGQIVVRIHNGTTSVDYTSVGAATGSWHHVVITRSSGGTLSIYLNGALDAQYAGALAPNAGTTEDLSAGEDGVGFLDELALYDYVLSPSRIATHWVLGHGEEGGAFLTLTASGGVTSVGTGGFGFLELSAGGEAIALYVTDTSNAFDGLDLVGVATVTSVSPAAAPPASLVPAARYDKAVPYPVPVMVNGRPT